MREETVERFGAVSEETAREMARGVRLALGADIGLATTGVAGPGGATPEKPVGLVWFALDDAARNRRRDSHMQLSGEREAVMQRSTTVALGMLWRHLAGQRS